VAIKVSIFRRRSAKGQRTTATPSIILQRRNIQPPRIGARNLKQRGEKVQPNSETKWLSAPFALDKDAFAPLARQSLPWRCVPEVRAPGSRAVEAVWDSSRIFQPRDGRTVVGSELKTFFDLRNLPAKWISPDCTIICRNTFPVRILVSGIEKMPPGHLLDGRKADDRDGRYWRALRAPKHKSFYGRRGRTRDVCCDESFAH